MSEKAITDFHISRQADEAGVDRFASAMLQKLAQKREEGRSGWNIERYWVQPDRSISVQWYGCSIDELRAMLREHIDKGDMVDIANFAMMIWNREHPYGLSRSAPGGKEKP